MSMLKTSTCFCLSCYKNIESSVKTQMKSDSIQIFTQVLNRLTKLLNTDVCLFEDKLLEKLNDINELLVYCANCQRTVVEICETFHTIKTLELQLDWKLDMLKETISYANKVPSRWVNFSNNLEELYPNDPSKKLATQNTIREFRKNVLNAGNRKLKIN